MLRLSPVRAVHPSGCSATLLRSFNFVPFTMCRLKLSGSPGFFNYYADSLGRVIDFDDWSVRTIGWCHLFILLVVQFFI